MSLLSNIWKTIVGTEKTNLPTPEKIELPKQTFKPKRVEIQKTKTYQVKRHLIEKGTIDSWTAIELYGATRLSSIIFNLRMSGYNIESISNTAFDRNNEICNFTTYKFINYNGKN